jgi:hypothetical protein
MPNNVATARKSDPVRLPEKFGPASAKVGLASDQVGLGADIFRALEAHYGSVKALAFELGQADPSLVARELKALDLRRFERYADAKARAVVSEAMREGWGELKSPEDYADRCIQQAQKLLMDLSQYVASNRRIA